jgi:hypothetical protein
MAVHGGVAQLDERLGGVISNPTRLARRGCEGGGGRGAPRELRERAAVRVWP